MNPTAAQLTRSRLDSHLLERAVLARGLSTVRMSPLLFVGTTRREVTPILGFRGSASMRTSQLGYNVARNPDLVGAALHNAAVPFEPAARPTHRAVVVAGRVTGPEPLDEVTADLAVRAVEAIPGLDHAAVDLTRTSIVRLDPSPQHISPGVAEALVTAQLAEVDVPEPQDSTAHVVLDIRMVGVADTRALRRKARRQAEDLELESARRTQGDGTVRVTVAGPLAAASLVPALLAIGSRAPDLIYTSTRLPAPNATPEGPA